MQRWEHAWECSNECQENECDKSRVETEVSGNESGEVARSQIIQHLLNYGQDLGFYSKVDRKLPDDLEQVNNI